MLPSLGWHSALEREVRLTQLRGKPLSQVVLEQGFIPRVPPQLRAPTPCYSMEVGYGLHKPGLTFRWDLTMESTRQSCWLDRHTVVIPSAHRGCREENPG